MSKIIVEPVSGGLVTSRPPSLLSDGELVECLGFYRPYSPSLWAPLGTTTFATPASNAGSVTGLRYCSFDFRSIPITTTNTSTTINTVGVNTFAGVSSGATIRGDGIAPNTTITITNTTTATLSNPATATNNVTVTVDADHQILVQGATLYEIAKATNATSTFAALSNISTSTSLETVPYNNQHVILNGQNPNLVLLANQTTRAHGLQPVTTSVSLTTGSGTWTAEEGIGFYTYWTTELDKPNNIESDFQGKKPTVINVTALNLKVVATKPTTVNPSATHWRLYRSTKMNSTTATAAASETIFPSGSLVGEAPIAQLTIEDGGTISSSTANPAGSVGQADAGWTTTSNALGAANGTFAVCSGAGSSPLVLELGTFGIVPSTLNAPISGIQVVVTGKNSSAAGRLFIQLKTINDPNVFGGGGIFGQPTNGSGDQTAQYEVPLTTTTASYTLGSSTNDWGRTWDPADFADGKFSVLVRATPQGATVSVDSVTVSVSYGAAYAQGGVTPFPAVVITYAGITTAVGRNGPPPQASTGDMFQDSLVLNDTTVGDRVAYSFPTTIDYFPTVYTQNFGSDVVRCVKTVGNILVVGLAGSIWRTTYLPKEGDAEFDRGRAWEVLDVGRGVVGPMAAARFTHPDGRSMLAFFSGNSFNMTDGYRIACVTNTIDFRNLVEPTKLTQTIVYNNPELYELFLIYVPKGGTEHTGVLRFNYHPTHIYYDNTFRNDGTFKCSAGPIGTTRAITSGVLPDGTRVLYQTNATTVVRGNQVPVNPSVTFTTRRLYPNGLNKGVKIIKTVTQYTLCGYAATSPGTLSLGLRGFRIGKPAAATDVDYTRVETNVTAPLLAYPAGTSQDPKDTRVIALSHNFGDTGISARETISTSNITCDLSVDFNVVELEPLGDEVQKYA